MSKTIEYNTRERKLYGLLTLKASKGRLVSRYSEAFGVNRASFYRRLNHVEFSPEEKSFFEQYFRTEVLGGADLLERMATNEAA